MLIYFRKFTFIIVYQINQRLRNIGCCKGSRLAKTKNIPKSYNPHHGYWCLLAHITGSSTELILAKFANNPASSPRVKLWNSLFSWNAQLVPCLKGTVCNISLIEKAIGKFLIVHLTIVLVVIYYTVTGICIIRYVTKLFNENIASVWAEINQSGLI